jgi:ubiquinone/menaquinone biosynthesis C-methylase UbiE/aminoglycoside phosphotransferase (APT) family kinase protein
MAVHDVESLSAALSPQPDERRTQLRCPRCRAPLVVRDTVCRCTSCSVEYPIREGIFDLRCGRHDYYFNPVPRRDMSAIIDAASQVHWDETVRSFMRFVPNVAGWTDNVEVNGRYAWKLFLELPPDARFLDLGCGLGNLTRNIAPHVRETVALDLTWERLRFAQQRFAKFNRNDRITVVAGGDGPHLPFPDAHFDCIALSGVLEWIADDSSAYARQSRARKFASMVLSFFGRRNPRALQLEFLRELRRVLKPEGQLFVAIENRLSHEYFGQRPDHHSRLWFGSLAPRFLANLYSIALRRRPYRTYTYSYSGLRRLFADAGFPHQEGYGLTPGYSRLAEIVPTSSSQPAWLPDRATTLRERIARSETFVPAFGMAARRLQTPSKALVTRLVESIAADIPELARFQLRSCTVTRRDRILVRLAARDTEFMLKIPASEDAREAEDRQARVLEGLAGEDALVSLTPKPLARGVFQSIPYYLESIVRGQPMASGATEMSRRREASRVADFLGLMHAAAVDVASDHVGAFLAREIDVPIARLIAAGTDRAACMQVRERLLEKLKGGSWKFGLRHGQLTMNNILVTDGSISGVLGWGRAVTDGLPALDAIGYLISRETGDASTVDALPAFERLIRWEWSCEEELALLRNTYRTLNVDMDKHEVMCLVSTLHHVAELSTTTARFDPSFVRRAILPVANWLHRG